MANLNAISSENLGRAAVIVNSVSGRERAPRMDYPPYIEEAVAGAAIALEKGHPHALRLARETKAEEWLDPNSFEGRHFHRAVARVLGGYEPGAIVDMSPKGMMEHIVADTVNTTLANRMQIAIKDPHPVMVEGMTERQVDRVDHARDNVQSAIEVGLESNGSYERVSASRRRELIDVFHGMDDVSPVARAAIDRAAQDIQSMRDVAGERGRDVQSRIADFKEDGVPLFRESMPDQDRHILDANSRAAELALGVGKGVMNEVEAGVAAHIAVKGPKIGAGDDGMFHDARVVVMVDLIMMDDATEARDPAFRSPHAMAMRIEGMALMMREADDYAYSYTRATDNDARKAKNMEMLAYGQPTGMTPDAQVKLFESLHSGDRVPALTSMRLHEAVRDLSSIDRSASVEMIEPVRSNASRAFEVSQGGMAR